MRASYTGLAALLALLILAVPANASTLVTNYASSGELAIYADAADNQIRVELFANRSRWRVTDKAGLVESATYDGTCVQGADLHTLECARNARKPALIQSLFAAAGDDKVVLARGVRGWDIAGAIGADTLIGANRADRLIGGAGDDKLDGGGGADRLYGSGGNDVLDAQDGGEDGLIECDGIGGGRRGGKDAALVDDADEPRGSCERAH